MTSNCFADRLLFAGPQHLHALCGLQIVTNLAKGFPFIVNFEGCKYQENFYGNCVIFIEILVKY